MDKLGGEPRSGSAAPFAASEASPVRTKTRKEIDNEVCRYFGWPTGDLVIRPADGVQGFVVLALLILLLVGIVVMFAQTEIVRIRAGAGNLGQPAMGLALVSGYIFWATYFMYQSRKRHRCYRRYIMGLCPSCAYDLRGSPGCCPECGKTPEEPKRPRWVRFWYHDAEEEVPPPHSGDIDGRAEQES
jgi:hypothetical protein